MKRVLGVVLTAALLLSVMLMGVASAEEITKTFAFGSDKQAVDKQGVNGWYYVYSEEFNKAGKFDVDDFKECVMSTNTGYAAWDGIERWTPESYAEEFKDATNWFIISAEGRVEGSGNRTAAVKWVAPYDGAFNVKATVDAGVSDQFFQYMDEYEDMEWLETYDGVHCLIYKDYDLLAENNTGVEWGWYDWPLGSNENWWEGWGQVDGSNPDNWDKIRHKSVDMTDSLISMKKGEALYFVVDNKTASDYDYAKWDIEISMAGEAVYTFGSNGSVPTKQGVDGWYFLYSKDINKGDAFDLNSFKECAFPGVASGIMAWGNINFWTPDVEESELADFITEDRNDFWWMLDPASGQVTPDGNMTAAVKWVVPVSGKYSMKVSASGGYSSSYKEWGLPDNVPNDGVYASVYCNGERIFSKDFTGEETEATALDKEMTLKAGDVFYFIMDPKALAGKGYDTGAYKVNALLVEKEAPAESTASTPEESTTSTTGSEDNKNPNTGAAGSLPAALLLMGAVAGVALVSKKKKA